MYIIAEIMVRERETVIHSSEYTQHAREKKNRKRTIVASKTHWVTVRNCEDATVANYANHYGRSEHLQHWSTKTTVSTSGGKERETDA